VPCGVPANALTGTNPSSSDVDQIEEHRAGPSAIRGRGSCASRRRSPAGAAWS